MLSHFYLTLQRYKKTFNSANFLKKKTLKSRFFIKKYLLNSPFYAKISHFSLHTHICFRFQNSDVRRNENGFIGFFLKINY